MSKEQEERLKTDCNVFIDRAIAMLKEIYKDEWLTAGYNGVVSLLQYAKESHTASSQSPVKEDGWIRVEQYLPGKEDYYEVKFEDDTTDEKPFRIRYNKNILGFMTEKKVTHWRPLPTPPHSSKR